MRVFHRLEELPSPDLRTAIAIGNFDGVHVGHVALLSEMIAFAKSNQLTPAVLTFFPHPVEVLMPGKRLERLTTTSEKLHLLEKMGVEIVLVAKFDSDLSNLEPEDFFNRFVRDGFGAGSVHVGFNFRFGKARAGNTALLASLGRPLDISVHVHEPVEQGGKRVSSSSIREYLAAADVEQAALMLGRPYALTGQVLAGAGRGKKLGFPTANLHLPIEKLLPRNGVYATRAFWQQEEFQSVTNIGTRPTFASPGGEVSTPVVETHFIDFDERLRIYEEEVTLQFVKHLREEKKFDSAKALEVQIRADVDRARDVLSKKA